MRCFLSTCLVTVSLAASFGLRGQELPPEEHEFSVPGAIARIIRPKYRTLDDHRRRLEAELRQLYPAPQTEQSARIGWKIFGYGDAMPPRQWVEIDLGRAQMVDAVALIPVDEPTANSGGPGFGFPRRFRVELEDESGSVAVMADFTTADFPNPGTLPVFLPTRSAMTRRVRVTMNKPWEKNGHFAYALGEIMVLSGNRNLTNGLRGVTVRTSGSLESAPVWSRENLIDGQSVVGAPLRKSERLRAHGWQSVRTPTPTAVAWAQIDLGSVQPFDEVRLVPARLAQYSARQGYGFPGKLRIEVADDASFSAPRMLADWSDQPMSNPAFNPVTVPADGRPARFVRVTALEFWQRGAADHVFALAELQVYRGDTNVAIGAAVTTDPVSPDGGRNFNPTFLTDGLRGTLEFIEWPEWLGTLSRRREILHQLDGVRAELAALQPAMVRVATWLLVTLLALLVLGSLAALYRARRAQARMVAALQSRIAGDLHDEIGSNLASIAMLTELGQQQAAGIAADDLEEIRRLAGESAAAMRDLVWLIQPGPHDAPRLTDRLRAAARRLLVALEFQFEIVGLDVAPSLDVQRHLLLALKEMLHNVLRHAEARRVEIQLIVRGERFTLEVRDDGRGFDLTAQGDGHGFASLRHRAELLGGTLELESRAGGGTRVALMGALHASTKLQPQAK